MRLHSNPLVARRPPMSRWERGRGSTGRGRAAERTGVRYMANDDIVDEIAVAVPQQARHRRHRPNSKGRRNRPGGRHISLWYDGHEYRDVAAAAGRAGLTPTSFVAAAALAVAREAAPPVPSPLHSLLVEFNRARTLVGRCGATINHAVVAFNGTGDAPVALARTAEVCARAVTRLDRVVAQMQRRLR